MEKRAKILVIDDEVEFTADLHAVLEAKAYHVVSASNREQAQERLRREKPDLVILGTIMPRGDAFSMHQWLKQRPISASCLSLCLMPRWKSNWLKDGG